MTRDEIKAVRQRLGYTQEVAAQHIGCEGRTWRRYESGERAVPEPVARLVRLIEQFPQVRYELEKMHKEWRLPYAIRK